MRKIILLSGKAQSGKDTFFSFMREKDFFANSIRLAFADNVKQIARDIFNWNGIKDEEGRKLLINIGASLGCEDIDDIKEYFLYYQKRLLEYYTPKKEFWVEKIKDQILLYKDNYDYFFITDWRYKKEYYYLKTIFNEKDIIKIRIERPDSLKINNHSEIDLDNFDNFDYIIYNDSSLEVFKSRCSDVLKYIVGCNYESI